MSIGPTAPPPPVTRSLEVVLRTALAQGDELRLIVAKALADGGAGFNANAYLNVEIEGLQITVPKVAGAGLGGPTAGYPVYLLITKDFILAVGSVRGSAAATPSSDVPIGSALPFGGVAAPNGYVLGDGSYYSKTTYAALYAVYGGRYGDGGTTFGVPDLRRRVPVGAGGGGGYDLGVTDGVPVGTRGPYHHHHLSAGVSVSVSAVGDHQHGSAGDHTHGPQAGPFIASTGLNQTGAAGTARYVVSDGYAVVAAAGPHTHPGAGGHGHGASGSVDADTSGSAGLDTPAFAVLNFIIRAI